MATITNPDTTKPEIYHCLDYADPSLLPPAAKKLLAVTTALKAIGDLKDEEVIAVLTIACHDLEENGTSLGTFQILIQQHRYDEAARHYKTMMDLMGAQSVLYRVRSARNQPIGASTL